MGNNYIEKIDQFLDGELSTSEHNEFEQAIENDATLETAVMNNLLLREAVEVGYQDQLRSNIKQWRSEAKNEVLEEETATKVRSMKPNRTARKWMQPLAIAASFLLLLSAGLYLYMPSQYSNDAIAGRYYEEDATWRSGLKGDSNDPIKKGINAYESGSYELAITELSQLSDNDKAIYGLAQSYYQIGDYSAAITNFKKVITRANPNYTENAEWYLLLSYLKNNQMGEEFNALLSKIISENGFYSQQAKEMQGRLNSFWRK